MKLEGAFGLYHLLYFVISIGLTVGGTLLIKKLVTKDKQFKLILRIIAGVLLVAVIVNRIATTNYHINIIKDGSSWWAVFPDSLCSICSLILGVVVLISPKKNNYFFYFVIYLGLIGDIATVIYPDFLDSQSFSLLNSWTGLLHHSISMFLIILIITKGYFQPSLKKFYIAPLGYMCVIIYGLFNISVFKLSNSMNILKPMLSSLKILTSWYMLGICFTLFVLIISVGYEHYKKYKLKK